MKFDEFKPKPEGMERIVELSKKSSGPQVPRVQVWKDLCGLLRAMPLSDEELREAYDVIRGRMVHKICSVCSRMTIAIEGTFVPHESGDLSKPKRFICNRHE